MTEAQTPGRSNEPHRPRKASEKGPVTPAERSRRAPGVALVTVSIALPATALTVPLLPPAVGWKVGAVSALMVGGEALPDTAGSSTPATDWGKNRR